MNENKNNMEENAESVFEETVKEEEETTVTEEGAASEENTEDAPLKHKDKKKVKN